MKLYEQIFATFVEGQLEPFYEYMYAELLAFATARLGNDQAFLAEDCVQNVIYRCYQRRKDFVSVLQWKGFLYTTLHNEIVSMHRKAAVRQAHAANTARTTDNSDLTTDGQMEYIAQETITLLHAAIEQLPKPYREVFHLSFEEGMKNAEIARQLGVAEVTIKKRKAKLISLLRERFGNSAEIMLVAILIE